MGRSVTLVRATAATFDAQCNVKVITRQRASAHFKWETSMRRKAEQSEDKRRREGGKDRGARERKRERERASERERGHKGVGGCFGLHNYQRNFDPTSS